MPTNIFESENVSPESTQGKSELDRKPGEMPELNASDAIFGSYQTGPVTAAATGFNRAMGSLPEGVIQAVTPNNSVIGQKLKQYQEQQQADLARVAQNHPLATAIGQGAGYVGQGVLASTLPGLEAGAGAGLASKTAIGALNLAGQGGMLGAAQYDPNGGSNRLQNAAIGAGLNLGLGGLFGAGGLAYQGAKNALQATKLYSNPQSLADGATALILQKTSGDLSSATPKDFFDSIAALETGMKKTNNANYAARDELANSLDVKVDRNNLASVYQDLKGQLTTFKTADLAAATRAAKDALGNGEPLSFSQAQSALKSLGQASHGAYSKGNMTLGKAYSDIQNALLGDVNKSIDAASINNPEAGQQLQALHNNAQQFFSQSYKPIRDLSAGNIQRVANLAQNPEGQALLEDFGEKSFMSNFIKKINSSNANTSLGARQAYNAFGDNEKNTLTAAMINGFKEANTTQDGMLNVTKFAQSLDTSLKKNPELYGSALDNIQTLSTALQSVGHAQQATTKTGNTGLGLAALGTGVLTGHPIAGASAAIANHFLPKIQFSYSAGKMLNDPEAQRLLMAAKNFNSSEGDPNTLRLINQLIGKSYDKFAKTIQPATQGIIPGTAAAATSPSTY